MLGSGSGCQPPGAGSDRETWAHSALSQLVLHLATVSDAFYKASC